MPREATLKVPSALLPRWAGCKSRLPQGSPSSGWRRTPSWTQPPCWTQAAFQSGCPGGEGGGFCERHRSQVASPGLASLACPQGA